MGEVLHKVFKAVVKEIFQVLPILGESGSEVSHFIPHPKHFAEVTRLSYAINKPWIKSNSQGDQNIIYNQTLLVQESEKFEPVTPYMDVYKAKVQYYGSLDKLKLIIVVRGDLQNKEFVRYTCSPT